MARCSVKTQGQLYLYFYFTDTVHLLYVTLPHMRTDDVQFFAF